MVENRDFCLPHLHSMPPLGGPHRNIAIKFGTEKLEWCGHCSRKRMQQSKKRKKSRFLDFEKKR